MGYSSYGGGNIDVACESFSQSWSNDVISVGRPAPDRNGGNRMTFIFRLEIVDGAPADPPTLDADVPDW